MKNLILIFALISFTFSTAFSQDILKLKSGETLEVKITKIGIEEIEFRAFGSTDQAVIKVDKFLVQYYKFENANSTTSLIAEKLTNIQVEELYSQKNHYAIKTQPLSAILGDIKLSYEQSITYNQSFEVEVGFEKSYMFIIEDLDSPLTFNTTMRYKYFYRSTSAKMTDTGKNPLHGLYIAPVFSFGNSVSMDYDYGYGDPSASTYNYYAAAMIDLGYQMVIQKMIVDAFVGVGTSLNSINTGFSLNSSHSSLGNGAFRAGFRVGINGTK